MIKNIAAALQILSDALLHAAIDVLFIAVIAGFIVSLIKGQD